MNFVNSSSCSQYAGASWDELKHIRQAVGFLVCPLCFYAKAFSTFLVLELTQSAQILICRSYIRNIGYPTMKSPTTCVL